MNPLLLQAALVMVCYSNEIKLEHSLRHAFILNVCGWMLGGERRQTLGSVLSAAVYPSLLHPGEVRRLPVTFPLQHGLPGRSIQAEQLTSINLAKSVGHAYWRNGKTKGRACGFVIRFQEPVRLKNP